MDEKTPASILKEQFAMLSILVVLIGIAYTDAYYARFGLRYQSINLPASHILYRGLTAVVDAPYLSLPYVIGVFWLGLSSTASKHDNLRMRVWAGYIVLALIIAMAYPLAVWAGSSAGRRDLGSGSLLPRIKLLSPAPGEKVVPGSCTVPDECRLLLVDSDYLYVFVPQEHGDVPHMKRLDRKVFNEIDTGTE